MKKYVLLMAALIVSASILQACGSGPELSTKASPSLAGSHADKGNSAALQGANPPETVQPSNVPAADQHDSTAAASAKTDRPAASDDGSAMPAAPSGTSEDDTAFSVVYHDGYKTIVALDESQIEKMTGLRIDPASIGDIINKLEQEKTWIDQAPLAPYAKLIAEAAGTESNRIRSVLNKMIQNKVSGLRLYISHSKHNGEAHFGTNNKDH